jgi:hypothetical protein
MNFRLMNFRLNAFVSPGVNSRGEFIVPSHGALRRRLGDKNLSNSEYKMAELTSNEGYKQF